MTPIRLAVVALLAVAAVAAVGVDARLINRFRPQWTNGQLLPGCTSELTGATSNVINAELRSRMDFNPTGATNPCGADGGNDSAGTATSSTCQVACKPGYVNSQGQFATLTCDSSSVSDGQLSLGGFQCQGPDARGISASGSDIIEVGAAPLLSVQLDIPAASDVTFDITCPGHTVDPATVTIITGSTSSSDVSLTPLPETINGECTFHQTGDDQFDGWTQTRTFATPHVVASIAAPAISAENTVTLTHNYDAPEVFTVTPVCKDSANNDIAATPATVNFGGSQTATFTLPVVAGPTTVTCTFTLAGNAKFNSVIAPLSFALVDPEVTLTGLASGAQLITGESISMTASVAPTPVNDLQLTVVCAATDASATTDSVTTTIVIPAGETTKEATFNAPLDAIAEGQCTATPSTDDTRFDSMTIAPIPFSTRLPTVTHSFQGLDANGEAVANSTVLLSLAVSDAVIVEDVVIHVTCGGVPDIQGLRIHVGSQVSSASMKIQTPEFITTPVTVSCTLRYDRGDVRYTRAVMPVVQYTGIPAPEPEPETDSSTGSGADTSSGADSGSDTGSNTGSADGNTGSADGSSGSDPSGAGSSGGACPDGECSAVVQASSGVALLLAMAAAMAAMRD